MTHYHYHRWPDFGVPESTEPIRKLVRTLWQGQGQGGEQRTAVVHCRCVLWHKARGGPCSMALGGSWPERLLPTTATDAYSLEECVQSTLGFEAMPLSTTHVGDLPSCSPAGVALRCPVVCALSMPMPTAPASGARAR